MQTATAQFISNGLPGQVAQAEVETESLQTAFIGQVTRLTISNGPYVATTYSVAVDVVSGYQPQLDYDGTADANATAAAAGLAAQWNADPQFRMLALATGGAGFVDLAWEDYTRTWAVTLSTADVATFTSAITTAASSTTARMGVFCKRGASSGDPRAARPFVPLASGDTVGVIRGVVMREDAGVEQPSLAPAATDFDYYPAPRAIPVCNRGRIWVVCETAMTVDGALFVRLEGTGIIGAVRNDADGGDAIDIATIAKVEAAGAAGGICKLKVNVAL